MRRVRSTFWPSLAAAAAIHGALVLWLVTRRPGISRVVQVPSRVRLVTRGSIDRGQGTVGRLPERPTGRPQPAPHALGRPSSYRSPTPHAETGTTPLPHRLQPASPGSAPAPEATAIPGVSPSAPQEVEGPPARGTTDGSSPISAGSTPDADGEREESGYTLDDLDDTPLILERPGKWDLARYYPAEEYRSKLEADVKVELTVDSTGRVIDVTIVGGSGPNFDAAARKLGYLMKFTPAMRRGRPVKMKAFIVFNFTIARI